MTNARESFLIRPSDRPPTGSNKCPKCGNYGKGPIVYQDKSMVFRHMVKRPDKPGKKVKICVIEPASKGER